MAELTIDELLGKAAELFSQVPTSIPEFKGVNNKPVQTELKRVMAGRETLDKQLLEEQGNYKAGATTQKTGLTDSAQAEADKILAAQARDQLIADNVVKINKATGVGIDPGDIVGKLIAETAVLKPQADAMLGDIQARQSVGPLDNPVEWLLNGLQLPSKIQAYNSQAAKINGNQAMISDLTEEAKNISTQVNRGVPTTTILMAQADAKKALADAQVKVGQLNREAAVFNIKTDNEKFAADLATYDKTATTTRLEFENAAKIYDSKIKAIEVATSMAVRLEKAAELKQQLKNREANRELIDRYSDAKGIPRGTLTPEIVAKLPKTTQEQIVAIGATGSFGNSPVDAAQALQETGGTGPLFSEDSKKVVNYVRED
jgi:hypothetical protein